MSDDNTVQVERLDDGTFVQILPDGSTRPLADDTDWERIRAMTEEEIEANALSDPDNPPLTDEELARFHRVPDVESIRSKLNLSQEQFAARFGIPLSLIRDWERRVVFPDPAARTLLRVIERNPEAVAAALTDGDTARASAA